MAVFTVHQPPLARSESAPDPARFTFVRDGFYMWGFLLSVLWMLRHRLWLVAILFVALAVLIEVGLRWMGIGAGFRSLILFAPSFLVGLEGATLRRWTLARRGYTNVGVVVADNQDDAERRFFVNWQAGKRPNAAPPPPHTENVVRNAPHPQPHPQPLPPRREPGDVIGSFPQPERPR